jgi:hypothetical protein
MLSSPPSRHFNLAEANTALETIRPLVGQILEIRQSILAKQPEVWPILEKAAGNGGNRIASQVEQLFQQLDALVRKIQATGAILKDANTGLVDFPSERNGREIYLCWQYGEEEIAFWHDVDAGFAGRRPL